MAFATLDMGRIPGIERPAIATYLPTPDEPALLLDAGANVDCTPTHLAQFALLGSVYSERVLKVSSPRVGLLNIGGEPGKGNELVKAAYDLLKGLPINFIGNVEGKDVFEHAADVVVCDGFAGNVLLKSAEGLAELMISIINKDLERDESLRCAFQPTLKHLLKRMDYAEYGGAPLLGVEGVSFIAHGRSHARAMAGAIGAAARASQTGYVAAIRDAFGRAA
jgi:glycerol-3-phosphate acyltransferase PlsX